MLEGVSVPSFICMVLGDLFADSWQFYFANSAMCVVLLANTTIESKKTVPGNHSKLGLEGSKNYRK